MRPPLDLPSTPGAWAELAQRLSLGAHSADDLARAASVVAGLGVWEKSGRTVPITQCIGLPSTEAQHVRQKRDEHLRAAAKLGAPRQRWELAEHLVTEWDRLLTLAIYSRWREQGTPDADACPMQAALFWASTFNRHESLCVRSVYEIACR